MDAPCENDTAPVRIWRADERPVSRDAGVLSRHSFSFGSHYDPGNVGFGLLMASNDDLVQPGAGYGTHPHRDVEIVTWVLDGALAHLDSTGRGGVVEPGLVQRMSAGRGVRHSEFNASGQTTPLRFVQMWVPPDTAGAEPAYAQADVTPVLAAGDLVVVASGMPRHRDAAVTLGQRAAAMHVARPTAGQRITLPSAPFVHVQVTSGSVHVEGAGALDDGDALRLTDEGGRTVLATANTELLVWEMHAGTGPPGA